MTNAEIFHREIIRLGLGARMKIPDGIPPESPARKAYDGLRVHPARRQARWYQNPRTKMCQPVPRHREIKEYLARSVIRKLSDPA
jgi:hypothetical protein